MNDNYVRVLPAPIIAAIIIGGVMLGSVALIMLGALAYAQGNMFGLKCVVALAALSYLSQMLMAVSELLNANKADHDHDGVVWQSKTVSLMGIIGTCLWFVVLLGYALAFVLLV